MRKQKVEQKCIYKCILIRAIRDFRLLLQKHSLHIPFYSILFFFFVRLAHWQGFGYVQQSTRNIILLCSIARHMERTYSIEYTLCFHITTLWVVMSCDYRNLIGKISIEINFVFFSSTFSFNFFRFGWQIYLLHQLFM